MARERWKDIQFNIPTILPLQPPPQTQEQVIPYIQALHNYLADDRLKVARAINLSNYFRVITYDDPADGDAFLPSDSKTQRTDENRMIAQLDTAAYSGVPAWEYYHTLATHVDVEQSDSTYNSLQDLINQMFSSGVISGFELTDAGSYQVAIAAGTCLLADSDDEHDRVIRFVDYAGETTAAIADGETKHILIEWNGGSPAYAFHASADLDKKDAFTLGWVTREGTTLHITNAPARVNELPHNVAHYLREVLGFTRANALGGLILGNTGTRNPTLSAGEIYFGLNEFDISAVDCSGADTFTRYYRVAGVWTKETGLTQWPNTQYTDGSDLQTMTVNRYGCLWFYLDLEDGNLIMLYGTSNAATQTTAESEAPPATVPPRVANGCVLVGRYVFQKSGAAPLLVQSAFNAAFNAAGVADHTLLSNIGTNTHSQIDSHIGSTSNPHSVTAAQVGAIKADGTVPLTADWDAGGYEIRAQTLEADVATGTAPLTVASTTKVTSLNADLIDGYHETSFLRTNASGRINALTAETTPTSGDYLLLELAGGGALRKLDVANLPSGGGLAPKTTGCVDTTASPSSASFTTMIDVSSGPYILWLVTCTNDGGTNLYLEITVDGSILAAPFDGTTSITITATGQVIQGPGAPIYAMIISARSSLKVRVKNTGSGANSYRAVYEAVSIS